MFVLIIVDLNDLLEAIYVFDQLFPLLTSLFKFIFNLDSVVIMFPVKHNAVHAEEPLGMVLASFYMTIEHLDTSSIAFAFDVICGCPIAEHRKFGCFLHFLLLLTFHYYSWMRFLLFNIK